MENRVLPPKILVRSEPFVQFVDLNQVRQNQIRGPTRLPDRVLLPALIRPEQLAGLSALRVGDSASSRVFRRH